MGLFARVRCIMICLLGQKQCPMSPGDARESAVYRYIDSVLDLEQLRTTTVSTPQVGDVSESGDLGIRRQARHVVNDSP